MADKISRELEQHRVQRRQPVRRVGMAQPAEDALRHVAEARLLVMECHHDAAQRLSRQFIYCSE